MLKRRCCLVGMKLKTGSAWKALDPDRPRFKIIPDFPMCEHFAPPKEDVQIEIDVVLTVFKQKLALGGGQQQAHGRDGTQKFHAVTRCQFFSPRTPGNAKSVSKEI